MFTGFGEMDLLATALEQRDAGMLLELLDLQRHRRLREVQLLRRAGKAQVAGGRGEDLQLPNRDTAHRRVLWHVVTARP